MPLEGQNQTILQKLGWSHWSLLPQYLLPLNHLQVVSYNSSSFLSVPLSQQWILEASVYVLRWNRHDTVAKLANSDMGCWLDQRSLNWTRNFPVPPVGNLASGLQMHWQSTQVKDGMVGSYWEEGISLSLPLAYWWLCCYCKRGCLKMDPETTERVRHGKEESRFLIALVCYSRSNHILM